MCGLSVGKITKNIINTFRVTGAASNVHGKDGEKHHVHSALNPSFVTESRMEVGRRGGVVIFIKCLYWVKSERRLSCVISNAEIFSYSKYDTQFI